MREISGGDRFLSQTELHPNFGLGDAATAETVRIKWPFGIVQELHDVPADQTLNVPGGEPRLAATWENGQVQLTLIGKQGATTPSRLRLG